MHLMLVEEAHNVLTRPQCPANSGGPEMAVADLFSNILSEIRSYGQGLMIVDQLPTRLIDDALKNTNYKIVHRLMAPDDIDVMAHSLSLNKDDGAAWVKIEQG